MRSVLRWWSIIVLLAAMPATSNYKLNNYGVGSGGTANSSTANYGLNAISGEQSGLSPATANYNDGTGNTNTQNAHVPTITISNTANYYNKLLVTIAPGANASDALYAIAISTNNFTTTNYIKSDGTITGSLTYPTDYRDYSGWGSGSGSLVTGLLPNTTYYVKAKAIQGKYSETSYGPVSSVATVGSQLSFSLATGLLAVPPFTIGFGTLTPGTVVSALDNGTVSYTTNAESGGTVYIAGANAGLSSSGTGGSIAAVNGNLNALATGFGAQGGSATQVSGGPFGIVGPNFNGSANNVGAMTASLLPVFSTSAPVTTGTASILFKAKARDTTPAATDYTETITVVAVAAF